MADAFSPWTRLKNVGAEFHEAASQGMAPVADRADMNIQARTAAQAPLPAEIIHYREAAAVQRPTLRQLQEAAALAAQRAEEEMAAYDGPNPKQY